MSNIYTSIDFGTNSIKMIVAEYYNDNFHVLASTSKRSKGIEEGEVVDIKEAASSIKNAIKDINDILGFKVDKTLICFSPKYCDMNIVSGNCEVTDYNLITGQDVSNVLTDAINNYDFGDNVLVTAMPIYFKIDDKENISDPKGFKGKYLSTKVVISTVPKRILFKYLEAVRLSGLDVIDVCFTSTGDYYTVKCKNFDNVVGAIINIGEESTNVSIFNKGIQIKNNVIPVGSYNVDKDLSYIFKIELKDARKIKEKFSVAKATYSDNSDLYTIKTTAGEVKDINQTGVSKVVEARIREILKVSKQEIKNLTNREIRYIIITGGLSEMAGFQYLVEDEFGFVAKICNIPNIGIRHNKYSSCYGSIKYFNDKLTLREKTYNMVSSDDLSGNDNSNDKLNMNGNIVSKVFGHFFDN